ncbi:Reticulocyte-binding protein 2 a [Coniochaeta hoffmannii]|uniref:Reticulocyte-binding protein 2 a n=1 Tax=Coniochaeta hoffmannii TaxID=91930 RepID=A0AA38SH03_9PEZI|nr:Reticulocyte-binding protein 2 a [Coniochaeta hoffmannii]
MVGHHHEPFKVLGPIDWTEISSQSESDTLPSFLSTTFASAQTLIDSIPEISKSGPASTGRARAATDSAALAPHVTTASTTQTTGDAEVAGKIRKDWKEVKVGAKENPMGISVWKLSAKDGKGAWFARRSVHKELPYERWRAGLEREFEETLRRNERAKGDGEIGAHRIRGIGAERRVEDLTVEGVAKLHVYLLSVRFPGPTTPRDFVTLLVTSQDEEEGKDGEGGRRKPRKPRQFMVISKPCQHPDAPQRQGFIRGQYESVEVIREVPVDKPLRRTRSSLDASRDEFARPGVDVENSGPAVQQAKSDVGAQDAGDDPEYAIEWVMITRSDPGGSVPRFMVEKGTPPGICTDAGKFVKWLYSEDFEKPHDVKAEGGDDTAKVSDGGKEKAPPLPARKRAAKTLEPIRDSTDEEAEGEDASGGLYGMITNALGVAGSYVASFTGSAHDTASEAGTVEPDSSDTESTVSDSDYASAEGGPTPMPTKAATFDDLVSSAQSTKSAVSEESATPSVAAASRHEKELRKLEVRKRKAEEKMAKMQEQALQKQASSQSQKDKEREVAALQKLKEKHEREMAKQEEKFRREVRKLEEKKAKEEKKEEERRRKAQEREERANIQIELERTRAERDVALKQMDILREQVGELQAQNTMLVAKLGKLEKVADAVRE